MSDDLAALAAEAYIYGFPLIVDMQEVSRFIREGMGSVSASPLNAFGHAVTLSRAGGPVRVD